MDINKFNKSEMKINSSINFDDGKFNVDHEKLGIMDKIERCYEVNYFVGLAVESFYRKFRGYQTSEDILKRVVKRMTSKEVMDCAFKDVEQIVGGSSNAMNLSFGTMDWEDF